MKRILTITKNVLSTINSKRKTTRLGNDFGKQMRQFDSTKDPLFIIGIKGSLHIIDLCLGFVPKTIPVILIFTGMDDWEIDWARKHFKVEGYITINTQLKHGAILDLLFKYRHTDFGIMDYDLFISNPELFEQLRISKNASMGNVLFMYKDPNLGVNIPQTFAMFFNASVIREIIRNFNVSCTSSSYAQLSLKVKEKLLSIGIDGTHLPEEEVGKNYFDTFRVVSLLGIAEGYEFNWVGDSSENSLSNRGVFHVSGISDPRDVRNRWRMRGGYFWQSVLALHPDADLQSYYQLLFPQLPPVNELEEQLKQDGYTGPWFFDSVQFLLKRTNLESTSYFQNNS